VPQPTRPFAVCVFCAASEAIEAKYLELAEQVGTAIAGRRWQLVSGGGSVSSMGAVARAARAGGAHTIGVIPRQLMMLEVSDRDADEVVVTDGMRERKSVMDARSDAFLALPGGLGTLEELLEVWVARTLGLHDKPVVALDPDGVFADLRRQVSGLVDRGFVRPQASAALVWAQTVEEALDAIVDLAGGTVPPPPTAAEALEADA
jgi:uncharacterized protein (TIGR00730 family)